MGDYLPPNPLFVDYDATGDDYVDNKRLLPQTDTTGTKR